MSTATLPTAFEAVESIRHLRLLTCGSVDDGKSTVIGRLLYDTDSIYDDQLAAIEASSRARGDERTNLALLTDGLRAEREQGITIDVAYRYFDTPRRSFVLADAPGHEQYTRNMASAASQAQVAVVLVDARAGVVAQTRRHATIAAVMGIRHFVLCVNKMDLVHWDQEIFSRVAQAFEKVVAPHEPASLLAIPMCAVDGDNIVRGSANTPWYQGPTLLEHLEALDHEETAPESAGPVGRLPVQWVIRPQSEDPALADYRGYAGRLVSGTLRAGDPISVLPSGTRSTITGVEIGGEPVEVASAGQSVTVRLADDVDVARGDLISHVEAPVLVRRDFEATVAWMAERPLRRGGRYLLRHTTRRTRCVIGEVRHRLDLASNQPQEAEALGLNDIGRITLRTAEPLAFTPYGACRATGAFVLIDEATRETLAAGTFIGPDPSVEGAQYEI